MIFVLFWLFGFFSLFAWNENCTHFTRHSISACAQVFFFKRKKQLLHSSFNLKIVSQIPEEDKDPVYKYFESMMTCARVREFNAKPPQVPILPDIFNTPTTSTAKEKKPAEDKPKIYFRTLYNHIKEGR